MTQLQAAELVLKTHKVYKIMEGKEPANLMDLAIFMVKVKFAKLDKAIEACKIVGAYAKAKTIRDKESGGLIQSPGFYCDIS